MSQLAPKYGLKVFAQFDTPRITHVSISTTPDGTTQTLPVKRAGVCKCHAGGMSWWDLMFKANENLMICTLCGDQWHRDTDFGTARWSYRPVYSIQEEP